MINACLRSRLVHPPQQTKPHTAGLFSPFNMNDQIYFRSPRDHNQSEADCLPCTEWKLPTCSLQGIPPVKWKSPVAVSQTSHVLHFFSEDPGQPAWFGLYLKWIKGNVCSLINLNYPFCFMEPYTELVPIQQLPVAKSKDKQRKKKPKHLLSCPWW